MASSHRKIENFLQPLGESDFTRNQALYYALLSIKNAFWVDRARNLQKLRERRNNRQKYFARMGNKARKSRNVVQALREQFPQPSGTRPGGRMLPYVFSGLIVAAPFIGLFNKEAKAEPVDTGIDLALNTKVPVMPEGSGIKVRTPPPEENPAPSRPFEIFVLDARAKQALNLADKGDTIGNLAASLGHRSGALIIYGDSRTQVAQNLVSKGIGILNDVHKKNLPVSLLVVDTSAFPEAADEMFKRRDSAFINPSLQVFGQGLPVTTRGPHGMDSPEDWQDIEDTLEEEARIIADKKKAPPVADAKDVPTLVSGLH